MSEGVIAIGRYDLPIRSLVVSVGLGVVLGLGGLMAFPPAKHEPGPGPQPTGTAPQPTGTGPQATPTRTGPPTPTQTTKPAPADEDYAALRATFRTNLVHEGRAPGTVKTLPKKVPTLIHRVKYTSDGQELEAWVNRTAEDTDTGKSPAVLFLHKDFSLQEVDFREAAQPFRLPPNGRPFALMLPSLRGENGQPGTFSLFYDEVNDVLAAAEHLAKMPGVDAKQMFIAGEGEGGTLALLAAMTSNRFKGAAAFGPSLEVKDYLIEHPMLKVPFERADPKELRLRSPGAFPQSFKCPVRLYYAEGDERGSTYDSLAAKAKRVKRNVQVEAVPDRKAAMTDAAKFFERLAEPREP